MQKQIKIVFSDLAKRFGRSVVFKGVSGEAKAGDVLTLTGPNGSGKSTIIRILVGLVRPTKGKVFYYEGEKEIARPNWRLHLGLVAPSISLYEELNALENLNFLAAIRGISKATAICRAAVLEVGLDPDRKTPVGAFSTGMQQRLKIAQAILHDPPILFFDEPGSNLDPSGKEWLGEFVQQTSNRGKAIILATNDIGEMEWGSTNVALP